MKTETVWGGADFVVIAEVTFVPVRDAVIHEDGETEDGGPRTEDGGRKTVPHPKQRADQVQGDETIEAHGSEDGGRKTEDGRQRAVQHPKRRSVTPLARIRHHRAEHLPDPKAFLHKVILLFLCNVSAGQGRIYPVLSFSLLAVGVR